MRRGGLFGVLTRPLSALRDWGGVFSAKPANPYYQGPVSDHFDGLRFFMPGREVDKTLRDLLAWRFGKGKVAWPDLAPAGADRPPARVSGLRVGLIGHASLLVQTAGVNILVDPVYAERTSPFSFVGPRRVNRPGIAFEHLPPIDLVLVTHNHYDHLDLPTLARIHAVYGARIVTALGNDTLIRQAVPGARVDAYDWGERMVLSDALSATLEPTYHWSARGLNDRRMALWTAFALHGPAGLVYLCGDTAYHDGAVFRDFRARHGAPTLAVLPIGAYEPRWFMVTQHANPDEAVQILEDLGAERAIGYHWGTFQLTDEGIDTPPLALAEALTARGIAHERFKPFRPGDVYEAES